MWICSCSVSIQFFITYFTLTLMQSRQEEREIEIQKREVKAKFETFDLVENFAVTNFSTKSVDHCTVMYRYSVYRFSALYRFRALNAGDGAWLHHKIRYIDTYRFSAPISSSLFKKIVFTIKKSVFVLFGDFFGNSVVCI